MTNQVQIPHSSAWAWLVIALVAGLLIWISVLALEWGSGDALTGQISNPPVLFVDKDTWVDAGDVQQCCTVAIEGKIKQCAVIRPHTCNYCQEYCEQN